VLDTQQLHNSKLLKCTLVIAAEVVPS
jgi:hypothetical protein